MPRTVCSQANPQPSSDLNRVTYTPQIHHYQVFYRWRTQKHWSRYSNESPGFCRDRSHAPAPGYTNCRPIQSCAGQANPASVRPAGICEKRVLRPIEMRPNAPTGDCCSQSSAFLPRRCRSASRAAALSCSLRRPSPSLSNRSINFSRSTRAGRRLGSPLF